MVSLNWTDFALENLNEIGNYIEKDSFVYAKKIVNRLFSFPDILCTQPFLGRIVPEFENKNIRELIKGNYRIIYRIVDNNSIDILSVHHSAQLLKNIPE